MTGPPYGWLATKEVAVPWKETRVVEQRLRFVASICEAEEQGIRVNFARLCEQFGISRAKGYKWVARFRQMVRQASSIESRSHIGARSARRTR